MRRYTPALATLVFCCSLCANAAVSEITIGTQGYHIGLQSPGEGPFQVTPNFLQFMPWVGNPSIAELAADHTGLNFGLQNIISGPFFVYENVGGMLNGFTAIPDNNARGFIVEPMSIAPNQVPLNFEPVFGAAFEAVPDTCATASLVAFALGSILAFKRFDPQSGTR